MTTFASISSIGGSSLAAVDTTKFPPHHVAYVQTVKDSFRLDLSSSETADGITVVQPAAGPGRWIRLNQAHPSWLKQATWFIHSGTGNDENTGIDSGHPIKTHGELQRRWGMIGKCAKIEQGTTVTIMVDTPDADVMNFDNLFAEDADLDIVGVNTVVGSGTFTAVGSINRATQTMQTVTDTALVGGWAAHVGLHMVRIVGGPRDQSTAWVMKDLGGSTARTTRFVRKEVDAFAPTSLAPQVGDAYQILLPVKVTTGEIRVQAYNDTIAGGPGVQDVKHTTLIDLFTHCAVENTQITGGGMGFVKLCHVRFDAMRTGGIFLGMQGCLQYDAVGTADRGFRVFGFVYSFACGHLNGPGGGAGGYLASNGYWHVDYDEIWQGTGALNIEGFFDVGTAAGFDISGNQWLLVNGPSATVRTVAAFDGVDLLWGTDTGGGSGNAVNVLGGKFQYTSKPTVNAGLGLGREARIDGKNLLWADVPVSSLSTGGVIGQRVI